MKLKEKYLNEVKNMNTTDTVLDNGYVITDKAVRQLAETSLSIFDWIFNHDKVTTHILVAHTELLLKYQDLPKKS